MTRRPCHHVPFIDLGRQHGPLRDELVEAFERVLGASAFILGEEVERFEAEFAEYCGARHCVGVELRHRGADDHAPARPASGPATR